MLVGKDMGKQAVVGIDAPVSVHVRDMKRSVNIENQVEANCAIDTRVTVIGIVIIINTRGRNAHNRADISGRYINLTLIKAVATLESVFYSDSQKGEKDGGERDCERENVLLQHGEQAQGRDEYRVAGPFHATYL